MVSYMGQITIYLPDEIEKRVRRQARRAKKSVSAYIVSLEKRERPQKRDKNGYTDDFTALFGSTRGTGFKLPPDEPPEVPVLGASISRRQRRLHRDARRR